MSTAAAIVFVALILVSPCLVAMANSLKPGHPADVDDETATA